MATFNVKILTPERLVFDGKVSKIVARTTTGDVCILANHIPYVSALDTGKMTIFTEDGKRFAAISGGFMNVSKSNTAIFTSFFEWKEEIDLELSENTLAKQLSALNVETDTTKKSVIMNKIKKARNRISVAKS